MPTIPPLLACHGMTFGPGITALILLLLAGWVSAVIMVLFNVAWIWQRLGQDRGALRHVIWLAFSLGLTWGAYSGWFSYDPSTWKVNIIFIVMFLIPASVIAQFFVLFNHVTRRPPTGVEPPPGDAK